MGGGGVLKISNASQPHYLQWSTGANHVLQLSGEAYCLIVSKRVDSLKFKKKKYNSLICIWYLTMQMALSHK